MSGMDMGSSNSTSSSHGGMDMGGSCKVSSEILFPSPPFRFPYPSWVSLTRFDHSLRYPVYLAVRTMLTRPALPLTRSRCCGTGTRPMVRSLSFLPRLTKVPAHHYLTVVWTACFLTSSWRVRGVGDYVGSLIGVRSFSPALHPHREKQSADNCRSLVTDLLHGRRPRRGPSLVARV